MFRLFCCCTPSRIPVHPSPEPGGPLIESPELNGRVQSIYDESVEQLSDKSEDSDSESEEEHLSLFTINNTLVNQSGEIRFLNKYTQVSKHDGVVFSGKLNERTGIVFALFAQKIGDPECIKLEYEAYKNLLEQLSDTDRHYMMPLYGISNNILIIPWFTGNLSQGVSLPIEAKVKISKSIIRCFSIILKHDFILSDIKEYNMLYRESDSFGVLCDFEGLLDFKALLKDPPNALQKIHTSVERWNPKHLIFFEFAEMYESLINLSPTTEALLWMQYRLAQLDTFAVGSSLYWFFTSDTPYPVIPCAKFPHLFGYQSQRVGWLLSDQLKMHCPEPLSEFILRMIDSDPVNRPSLYEIETFLK